MARRSSRNWGQVGDLPYVLLAVCASALAQSGADLPPASVSGAVTNSVTGAPILRAHVKISTFSSTQLAYGALTNAEGKFTIGPVPPGQYDVTVERTGFVSPPTSMGMGRMARLNLQSGDKQENLKLTLTPTGSIAGRALDPRGEPLPDCSVSVEGNSGNAGSAVTDDRGQYRIGGLAPGKYRVRASPNYGPIPPEIRTDGTEDVNLAASWFPGAIEYKAAQRVEVSAGGEVNGIDIHPVKTAVVSVTGKVIGAPEGRVLVQAQQPNGRGGKGVQAKADGTFRIWRMDPGKYTLVASMQNAGPSRLQSAPVDIEVGVTDIERVELRMVAPFDVSGQLDFEDAAARQASLAPPRMGPPGSQTAPRQAATRRVQVRPVDNGTSYGMGANQQVDVSADDAFTLEKLPPGRYHLSVSWGAAYVKSVRQGSVDTEGDILDVRNGANGAVTVRVSSAMAEVSGTVTDSNGPAAGVPVSMVPEQQGARNLYIGTTGKDGSFDFGNVVPGKYRLLAAESDVAFQLQRSPDVAEDYKDIIESIEVHAGDKVTKNLSKK